MADRNNKPWISYLVALLLLTYKTIISDRSDDFELSIDNYTCTLLHFGFLLIIVIHRHRNGFLKLK